MTVERKKMTNLLAECVHCQAHQNQQREAASRITRLAAGEEALDTPSVGVSSMLPRTSLATAAEPARQVEKA